MADTMCPDCLGSGTIYWTELENGKVVQKSKPCPCGGY